MFRGPFRTRLARGPAAGGFTEVGSGWERGYHRPAGSGAARADADAPGGGSTRPTGLGLSARHAAKSDIVDKLTNAQSNGVPHYWIVDPDAKRSRCSGGRKATTAAKRGERVRAEPFGEVELNAGLLFGDEEA
jgi:hypothetical protein